MSRIGMEPHHNTFWGNCENCGKNIQINPTVFIDGHLICIPCRRQEQLNESYYRLIKPLIDEDEKKQGEKEK